MNNRQIRLLGLSSVTLFLIFTLYKSSGSQVAYNTTANTIIDSANNAEIDRAINEEIGRLNSNSAEDAKQDSLKLLDAELDANIDSSAIGSGAGSGLEDDADLVLETGFDPVKELIQIRSVSPMVIFSKTYCPYSKRLKNLLKGNYEITPTYAVVELDKHKNGKKLQEYLGQISGRNTVPNVLIGDSNTSKGGCDDFLNLHESGKLEAFLNEWGAKKLSVKKIEAPSNM